MEKLLESIRVPCSNAAYGCAAKPVYYDRDTHLRFCKHAPRHCTIEACGFVGSTLSALLDHFFAVHVSMSPLREIFRKVQV
jgi:E3 ubiquitin-protein ligase SIAH1